MFIACNALESDKPIYGQNGFPTAVPFDIERFRTSGGIAESRWLNFLGTVAWCNSFNH